MDNHSVLHLGRRPRRLRRTAAIRNMIQENRVTVDDLIMPLFVIDGEGPPQEIASMPGQRRLNIEDLVKECESLASLGVPAAALFPFLEPSLKDAEGSGALDENTLVLRAVRAIKKNLPQFVVITDIALDPYTSHGHDGVLNPDQTDV